MRREKIQTIIFILQIFYFYPDPRNDRILSYIFHFYVSVREALEPPSSFLGRLQSRPYDTERYIPLSYISLLIFSWIDFSQPTSRLWLRKLYFNVELSFLNRQLYVCRSYGAWSFIKIKYYKAFAPMELLTVYYLLLTPYLLPLTSYLLPLTSYHFTSFILLKTFPICKLPDVFRLSDKM